MQKYLGSAICPQKVTVCDQKENVVYWDHVDVVDRKQKVSHVILLSLPFSVGTLSSAKPSDTPSTLFSGSVQ